ncbi:MAG: methionine--tRNA ligase, partial [Planctomycetes bacterium]|nr:methionine--tRNA ligase [Planctomycetota bacterium]
MSIEDKKNFYITTTLPYVNAEPHIGFAAEIVRADVIARYQRNLGKTVFFNTGTDEHGLKIYNKAQENNLEPQKYCDEYAAKFDNLKQALNLSYNSFIRTTDEHHLKAAQEFWRLCEQNGDIYKKTYSAKYCVGCELEKTDSELDHGRCPLHPDKDLEVIEEENYFFRFSKYQEKLLELYQNNASFVLPDFRLKEIKNFVEAGLNDFSISRLKSKMPWGVPVPGDENQVMYVWFDALVNYISCLGWPDNKNQFNEYWPVIQVAGKDNLRQQSAIWQAMLLSAGLKPSQQILIFGFITANGQKMSKSLGNTIDPYEVITKYGTDPLRYYLLSEIKVFYDSDFSYEKFDKLYNADLANGLGNLVARVSNLLEKNE